MNPGDLLTALGRFRLILFDCDGTLVDSAGNIVDAMAQAFAAFDFSPPAASATRRQIGLTLETAIANLLGPQASKAVIGAIAEHYRQDVRQRRERGILPEPLFPGIRDLLDSLAHPEVFLGVATGKNRRGLDHTLAVHGLVDRFHTLQTGDIARSKPDPDMVLRAAMETSCPPERILVIGDTRFDVEMALAAGATPIGVAWGYHDSAELHAAGATLVLDRAEDLLPRLSGLDS